MTLLAKSANAVANQANSNATTANNTANSALNELHSIPALKTWGRIDLWSEIASASSPEGSQIVFRGKGGNTGDNINLDGYNNNFRIFSNFGGQSLSVYDFTSTGIYLNSRKITN